MIDGFGELPAYSQHHVTNVFIDLDLAATPPASSPTTS